MPLFTVEIQIISYILLKVNFLQSVWTKNTVNRQVSQENVIKPFKRVSMFGYELGLKDRDFCNTALDPTVSKASIILSSSRSLCLKHPWEQIWWSAEMSNADVKAGGIRLEWTARNLSACLFGAFDNCCVQDHFRLSHLFTLHNSVCAY